MGSNFEKAMTSKIQGSWQAIFNFEVAVSNTIYCVFFK
jgi:hypothetical protein